ncbi:MAG TPA: cytochrome c, partial [Candidatus Methanoperedens sp.]
KLSIPERWDVVAYLWTFWMDPAGVENGKTIYQKNCASCHGINGDGSGIAHAVDFTNASRMAQKEPELFFNRITDGGASMPSWKDSLSVDERWNTVKYIWTFQFKDYFQTYQPPLITPDSGKTGEAWYFTPSGMAIIVISILLSIAVLYLFGKGMLER